MNALTQMAMGLLNPPRPRPLLEAPEDLWRLPTPAMEGGLPFMEALRQRQSGRSFAPQPLSEQCLADLLWAADGVNRPGLGGRTSPSALNAQEVEVYAVMGTGAYRYDPVGHALYPVVSTDVRRVTGYQDFVDEAPLDLVFVADHRRMGLVPAAQRSLFAAVSAGAMAQNVYLYAASHGLVTVLRAWFDRSALANALLLDADHEVLLAQTVGHPRS